MEMTSKTRGTVEAKVFEFEWKIERFFRDCREIGDYYDSPLLPVNYPDDETQWFIRVYPNGINEDSKDHVSIFLHFRTAKYVALSVDCAFTIVSERNKLLSKCGLQDFLGIKGNAGWPRFKSHSEVCDYTYDILSDFKATISCAVVLKKSVPHLPQTFRRYESWIETIKTGFSDFEQLLESGSFSDVTFNVEGKQIKLHKAVLSCRSPVFQAMFEHEMKENIQNSVDITDISYNVMMELLRFIYSGKVENMEAVACELLAAADKYQVMELKSQCQQNIYDELSEENAIFFLKEVEDSRNIHFNRLIINYVAANYKSIITLRGFSKISSKVMHQVMLAIANNDAK